ncbi:tudor and KH domain-containing protein [Synchiropus splendidus]|uniref:tudor and KH domain-containing protein n=1 Tax=Synchiropus splendidus TaxID=270530 RepID=UPI00237E666B|nr:tudor and KH domain-containing protein [Synchiropus splendidus]XP_053721453.1 tudor and KH domain-containing protein [Synchiropus splendidus]
MEVLKEGQNTSLGSFKAVAVAAGISVGAAVGYIVYRHVSSSHNNKEPDQVKNKLTLSLEAYRNICKRQETFLAMVTQKSGAQVRVESDPSQAAVHVLLQGSDEQVLLARCVLENLVSDCEPVVETLEVPQTAFGRIIGRGGESVKLITRSTGASVSFTRDVQGPGATGKVVITGTKQAVKLAKESILEKVHEDMLVRTKIVQSSAQRQRRGQVTPTPIADITQSVAPLCLNNNNCTRPQTGKNGSALLTGTSELLLNHVDKTDQENTGMNCEEPLKVEDNLEENEIKSVSTEMLSDISKFEIPSPDLSFQPDEHLEVYVSASENPNHFWIQILGVRSLQLDKLTKEMSHFYSSGPNEQRVETIVVGDIVAAPYRDFGSWNRARVLGTLESGLVDLYYVDYGDNAELPRESLCRMRSDFLSLPFQAIECSLAGVRPKGEVWTEDALDDFEALTHCANWRPLQAKLCSYSHSDISSWPSVKLYDNSDGTVVDIGEELIRLGHAVSFQEVGDGRPEGDHPGCLQKMLDDVIGASSELSMSCISLSEAASISGSVDDVIEDELL